MSVCVTVHTHMSVRGAHGVRGEDYGWLHVPALFLDVLVHKFVKCHADQTKHHRKQVFMLRLKCLSIARLFKLSFIYLFVCLLKFLYSFKVITKYWLYSSCCTIYP